VSNESPEQQVMVNIQNTLKTWAQVVLSDVTITRMSGLSNYCVKVQITDRELKQYVEPNVILYRRFESVMADK
jgi:hypothetical protein